MTDETELKRRYLIRKGGYWYRPDACGYTSSVHEAGRYSLEDAIRYSHPNGPDGPRDGLSYVSESDAVKDAPPCMTCPNHDHDALVDCHDLAARVVTCVEQATTSSRTTKERLVANILHPTVIAAQMADALVVENSEYASALHEASTPPQAQPVDDGLAEALKALSWENSKILANDWTDAAREYRFSDPSVGLDGAEQIAAVYSTLLAILTTLRTTLSP